MSKHFTYAMLNVKVSPRMSLKLPSSPSATPIYTDRLGNLIRQHGANVWEVWEQDVSQHFLITVQVERQPPIDVIQLTERKT